MQLNIGFCHRRGVMHMKPAQVGSIKTVKTTSSNL